MDHTELRLAQIIDEWASFKIAVKKDKYTNKIKFRPTLIIGTSDKTILTWIVQLYPSTIHEHKPVNHNYTKPFYFVRYQSLATKAILDRVWLLLKKKKAQAEVLRRAFELKDNYKQGSHVSLAEEYYKLIKQLH